MPRSSHGDKYTVSVMKTVEDRGEEMFDTRKIDTKSVHFQRKIMLASS